MFQVYAIYNSSHDKIYIGQTEDLTVRLKLHNTGEFKNSYTSRFDGEWELIYKEECSTRPAALKREKQLKSYQGRLFVRRLAEKSYSPVAQRYLPAGRQGAGICI